MSRLYQEIFDRAKHPLVKIGACTLIGAIAGALAAKKARQDSVTWTMGAAAGAGLGFAASLALVAGDAMKSDFWRTMLLCIAALIIAIGACIVLMALM